MHRSTKQPKRLILDTARKKIPFQRLASSRVTGTELDAFATAMVVWLRFRFLCAYTLSKWCTVMMLKMSSN
jgi:hypothetical protein